MACNFSVNFIQCFWSREYQLDLLRAHCFYILESKNHSNFLCISKIMC